MSVSIQHLQQIEMVQEYTVRFYTIVAKIKWDNNALVAIYYRGLKDPIKDELSREDTSKDIEEIVMKAIKINGYLKEWRMEKRNWNFTWVPSRKT